MLASHLMQVVELLLSWSSNAAAALQACEMLEMTHPACDRHLHAGFANNTSMSDQLITTIMRLGL